VADDLERPDDMPEEHGAAHGPAPTIWPVGFAFGIALLLIGLVIGSWPVVAAGAAFALVFGFVWVHEATREVRGIAAPPAEREPSMAEVEDEAAEEEVGRVSRARFLEAATLGIGGIIGAGVTLPALGFAIAPAFTGQESKGIDLGPLDNFPESQWMITQFFSRSGEGTVGRRTAFIRNNGMANGVPSFTIISNRCVHLGCPVQPQGPSNQNQVKKVEAKSGEVVLTPTQPSGFGCPCHGGAYDTEGNRTAGPPVRSLDRYEYSIVNGHLVLEKLYSVGHVDNAGANAKIEAYRHQDPGTHVDGPEQYFYPYTP
jgi:menaquinol-cytochrome c reductase iron-sulfur subunit